MFNLKDWLSAAFKCAAALPLLYCVLVPAYRRILHPLRNIPGPRLASLTDLYAGYFILRKDTHRQVLRNHIAYGPVVRHGPNRLLFNTTSAVKAIYQNPRALKSFAYDLLTELDGYQSTVDAIDKHEYRRRRLLIGRALNESTLRSIQPVIARQLDILLKGIEEGAKYEVSMNMTTLIRHLMFDTMALATFGYPLEMQTNHRDRWMTESFTHLNQITSTYLNVPDLFRLRLHSILSFLDPGTEKRFADLCGRILSGSQSGCPDIFTVLREAWHGNDEMRADDNEIFQETLLLLIAGTDTMTTAICATLFYLSREKACYDRLAAEVRSAFSSAGDMDSGARASSLPYLRACIDESLRMSPPGAGVPWREQDSASKRAGEPFIVDGHAIPPGTQVGVGIYAIHHNEEYFASPFSYEPERWLGSETSPERLRLMQAAFMPFSRGSRACPGKALAYAQVSLVLAKIMWYFDFEKSPGALELTGSRLVHTAGGEVKEEFDTYDIFVSEHDGPQLVFKAREDMGHIEAPPACII